MAKDILAQNTREPARLRAIAIKLHEWKWYRTSLFLYGWLVKLEPENDNTWCNRGILLSRLRRYKEAEVSLRKAIFVYPQHKDALYNLGVIFSYQEKYVEAIDNFKLALKLTPSRGLYWYGLALAQEDMNNRQEALKSVAKAVKFAKGETPEDIKIFSQFQAALMETARGAV